ncbi:inhibin beta E chain-like [Heliangelus exortis]|uniref:inhibin beta E chain-like n=1 Tax=Heliangelus exortis TaxID=472823 RepID=UPI003A8D951D
MGANPGNPPPRPWPDGTGQAGEPANGGGGARPAPGRRCPKRAGRPAPLPVLPRSVPSVLMAARGAVPWLLLAAVLCAAAEPRCPSCAAGAERRLLEEAAKRQLLEKLRLRERPRLSHAVPRAAVARALRRLQAGGARRGPDGDDDDEERAYEIISFAEPEPMSPSGLGLQFQFSRPQDQDIHILRAQLWLYLRVPRDLVSSLTLRIFLAGGEGDLVGGNRTLLSERRLSPKGSGWRAFTLLPALQRFFLGERRTLRLELESRGDRGDIMAIVDASRSQQPFLVAEAKLREPGHRVAKRSLRCSQNSNLCCRRDYYVDFRDIGWNDWIIKPEGYQINYCVGQCPLHVAGSPGMASSFHTAVFNLVKANNVQASGHSCCVPTRRRPLSVLYFDRNSNIVKTDIPDMIVDACGCS